MRNKLIILMGFLMALLLLVCACTDKGEGGNTSNTTETTESTCETTGETTSETTSESQSTSETTDESRSADETTDESRSADETTDESRSTDETTGVENETTAVGDETTVCEHTFGDWENIKQATCKEEGKLIRTCSKCFETETQTLPKSDNHTVAIDEAVSATCKDTGLTEGSHCSVCNEVLVAQTVVPKTEDHSSSNWIVDAEATCKAEGEKHKECTVCKQVLESEKIEKSATHTALKNNVEMPSGSFCGDAGSCFVSVSCAVCGEMISSGYQDIPERHSMANGACQACGLPQSTTAGLYFGLNSDGKSYYVMPGRNFAGGNVVIGVYNNLSVTEVDFVGCDSLTSIVIGDCVERIGSFEACFNLISVTIGDRIREIPEYAFLDCSKLSTITFGDGVEKIGENAFSNCSRLYYAYISGSHDWWCGGDKFYGNWIGKEYGMESYFADYLKQYPWEWYRE